MNVYFSLFSSKKCNFLWWIVSFEIVGKNGPSVCGETTVKTDVGGERQPSAVDPPPVLLDAQEVNDSWSQMSTKESPPSSSPHTHISNWCRSAGHMFKGLYRGCLQTRCKCFREEAKETRTRMLAKVQCAFCCHCVECSPFPSLTLFPFTPYSLSFFSSFCLSHTYTHAHTHSTA